ncbi:MAG: prolyl oligopeptidase family serine peptidase [Anaerolineae bacterium]|nr:prolyl oligopeptidase family serine peptidase [Anaerolineae bacterium]
MSGSAPAAKRRRFLRAVILTLILLILALPTLVGAWLMMAITLPGCGGETIPPVPFEDVSFPSAEFGKPTRAFFIPGAGMEGQTAPVVIVLPTLAAGRGDRMAEALVYHERGLHVLTFESRACVGGVPPSLGVAEAAQVGDALAYLAGRPDVDMTRTGLHGFSAGGAAALMAAAQYPAIAAVVAQGNYAQIEPELSRSSEGMGLLKPAFEAGARLGYRLMTGRDLSSLDTLTAVTQMEPRPLLLVYGSHESADEPQALSAAALAAGSPVTVWIVPGAGHGDYIWQGREAYVAQVGGFMANALGSAP